MIKSAMLAFVVLAVSDEVFQDNTDRLTVFEVASVKPALASLVAGRPLGLGKRGGPGTADPGQITWLGVSLKRLIMTAYSLKDYQINGPGWLETTGVDVVAKVPKGTDKQQVLIMWQNLLKDRLRLMAHLDEKELPVYEMVLAGSRLKIKESGQSSAANEVAHSGMPVPGRDGCPVFADGSGMTSLSSNAGVSRLCASAATFEIVLTMLAKDLDRPVLNRTGLEGKYDFRLEFGPQSALAQDVFRAFEQLGLKLVPRRAPVQVLIVDSIDRVPTPN